MTVLIELPGTLASTAGLERIVTTVQGFPDAQLADLFLFADNTGVAPSNTIAGRSAGLIERLSEGDYGGSHAWLGAAGGLELRGTEMVALPAFDPTGPWSLVYMGAVTGHVSGATEAITALLAFRDRSNADVRGPGLYARSFHTGGTSGLYQHRTWSGSTAGAAAALAPSANLSVVGSRRLAVLSYDGSAVVTSTLYDKNGAVVASGTLAAADAGMTTSGGVVKAEVRPSIGISNAVYDGGIQQVEAFARYSRVLTQDDITRLCARGAALGASRGRPW